MSYRVLPLLLTLTIPAFAQQAPQPPRTLPEMRDRYRPLLIFAPPREIQGRLLDQVNALKAHRSDLIDRQIMLVPSYGGGSFILDPEVEMILWSEAEALHRQFHVHPNDFTVILLGKDGGEKFRSHTPVTIEQLNRIIDAMPMRRQEMRERPRANTSHFAANLESVD